VGCIVHLRQRPNEATVVPPSEHPRLRQRRLGFQEPPAGREHHRSQSLRALRGTPNLDTVPTVERASSATRGAHEAAPTDTAWTNLGISWGLVLTGGMNRERCSWPGMIRGVEARIDPAEGAPFRCLTLPCSSTLVRAWMSLRSRRSRTRVRCC